MPAKKLTYKDALSKLQKIADEIENEDVDVDKLTLKVKEATRLIKFCKDKLSTTQKSVDKAIEELEEETGDIENDSDLDG